MTTENNVMKNGVWESFRAKKARENKYIALWAEIEIPRSANVSPVETVASQSKRDAPKNSLTIGILSTTSKALTGRVKYII